MITQIYHKKNELFEVEFYKDKECTETFDFTGKKNLYIELINGDITPLIALDKITPTDRSLGITAYVPYIPNVKIITNNLRIKTLDDITPNLSKYIPEDNAVLFLSEDGADKYADDCEAWFLYQKDFPKRELNSEMDIRDWKKLTIFLPHGTQSELQKAVKVKKELKEKYGVEEVNLCVLHWFGKNDDYDVISFLLYYKVFNEIITTNSTGILKAKDFRKRLQVIDCKEIFEEYLKENVMS